MSAKKQEVQKLDVQLLDRIRQALSSGIRLMSIRERLLKFNFWRGSVEVRETTTIVEAPHDSRN
jgi:hypothetical protein